MEYRSGALYIRVSTERQEELSPDAQKRLLLDYAKKNKILIQDEHIFIENGISGRTVKGRPEFMKMIATAKQKPAPFQVILVWKFSRFARNQEESIVYKSMLKNKCNIDVISTSEPLIEGPFGSLIERIIEWMDEYYSVNLSGEVIRGMTEKALRGGYQTTPSLGYQAVGDGKPFTVVQEESKIVQYIFEQYVYQHKEPTRIARQINEMGIKTKRNCPFERRTVMRILQNRFYIGELRWNDITAQGKHETFISKELFEQAQKRIKETARHQKQRSVSECKHWLSGLIKCSICGSSLSYQTSWKGFVCWKYTKGFHKGSSAISESKVVQALLDYLKNILNGDSFELSYIEQESSDNNTELETYQLELKRLESREKRVKEAYEAGIDSLEEYKENKNRLLAERQRIENKLKKDEQSEVNQEDRKKDFLSKVQTVYDVIKLDGIDYETKGVFLRSVIHEIIYDRETDTLTFRLYSIKK